MHEISFTNLYFFHIYTQLIHLHIVKIYKEIHYNVRLKKKEKQDTNE